MHVPADFAEYRDAGRDAVAGGDGDQPGEVEGVINQLHPFADEELIDLIGVGLQRHRRGLRHRADRRPAECFRDDGLLFPHRASSCPAGIPALQRGLPRRGVDGLVVNHLHPRREQRIQFIQRRHHAAHPGIDNARRGVDGGDLGEELRVDGVEEPLDLPAALRPIRLRVRQPNSEACAGPREGLINKSRAVIDVNRARDAARFQRRSEGRREADGVFGVGPLACRHHAGVVVEEREQIRFPPIDARAVQPVTDPHFVRVVRFEPAEHFPHPGREFQRAEVPQQRRLARRVDEGVDHDAAHLR
jgi:hypothetical protein